MVSHGITDVHCQGCRPLKAWLVLDGLLPRWSTCWMVSGCYGWEASTPPQEGIPTGILECPITWHRVSSRAAGPGDSKGGSIRAQLWSHASPMISTASCWWHGLAVCSVGGKHTGKWPPGTGVTGNGFGVWLSQGYFPPHSFLVPWLKQVMGRRDWMIRMIPNSSALMPCSVNRDWAFLLFFFQTLSK